MINLKSCPCFVQLKVRDICHRDNPYVQKSVTSMSKLEWNDWIVARLFFVSVVVNKPVKQLRQKLHGKATQIVPISKPFFSLRSSFFDFSDISPQTERGPALFFETITIKLFNVGLFIRIRDIKCNHNIELPPNKCSCVDEMVSRFEPFYKIYSFLAPHERFLL